MWSASGTIVAGGRILLSMLLAAGGVAAIYFGYRLFLHGSGMAKGVDKFEWKSDGTKLAIGGMSVGGLLMLTAAAWGFLAYKSAPVLEASADIMKITDSPKPLPGSPAKAMASWPVIGAPVIASDHKPVGTISSVVLNASNRPTGFVVDTQGEKGHLVFPPQAFTYSNGNVTLGLTKAQVDKITGAAPARE